MQEQLIRKVSRVGNGAHIFVPKEWINENILLVRTIKQNIEEKILEILNPYLENISAVFLYGSYARNEQTPDSDIDILVISNKKFKVEKSQEWEINVIDNRIKDAIKINPILIYSILSEAKPIINSQLLKELKEKYQPKLKDFKDFLKETELAIKTNEEFLNLEKEEYTNNDAVAYSLILRLKGIYIINTLLAKKKYSKKDFEKWIKEKANVKDYESIFNAYLSVKKETEKKLKMRVYDLILLLKLLEKETMKLEEKHDKKKKTSRKRH